MSPPAPFAELVAATNYSFLRGASHPEEMVKRAAELGLCAIGIADRNTLAGVVRAHAAAKEAGIALVVGARLVTEDGLDAVCHPSDRAAYGRLCRLLTAGNRRTTKGDCRLAFAEVLAAAEGQQFILMPPAEIDAGFLARALSLAAAAPGAVHLGATSLYRGDERRRLAALASLAAEIKAPLVATNDALYHEPARQPLADVLACIREKCTIGEAGYRLEANAERHLKDGAEMARLFRDHPDAVARTRALADRARFSLEALRYEYPDEPVPAGKTPQEHLEELTFASAAGRYPEGVPAEVAALLRKELKLIAALDYARYFLTVHDVVAFARSQGILCQGRGSAANSAVCYCLGITAVDPTKIQLLFERFISAERREPPDIDVDFEHERREEVIQYLYRRYGRERAAICATVIHYRPKSALREVGKAMGLAEDVTAALAGAVWGWGHEGVADAHIRAAGLDPANPALHQAIALTRRLIGFPRHLSQHVGGFILTRGRLDETVPIGNGAMPDRTFIEWDKDDIDALGILKVDVLALGMLTAIKRAFGLIETHYGRRFATIAEVPAEDPQVYAMLSRADSVGVFQVESRAQMSMLPRLKPQNFYDLVIEVAIVRPGPIQGDMVHPYLRRRAGLEPVEYPSEALRHVLEKTYGVPLFQEQAMQIAIVAAGFTPGEADKLRRAMATFRHAGTIHGMRDKFIAGMIANGYARDFAERCFKQIEGFGDYGFPESHAASFALLVYVSAWIKRHYPQVFCAALLNSQPMGFYQPAQLVRDAREHGVEVRPPDVNHSDWDCTLEGSSAPTPGALRAPSPPARGGESTVIPPPLAGGGRGWGQLGERSGIAVRLGLRLVAGLAEAEGRAIVAARGVARHGAGYDTPSALWRRSGVGRAGLTRLAGADAFGSLGLDRRAALWAVKGLDEGVLEGETPLAHDPFPEPAVALPVMPLGAQVAEDYAATGLSLKAHPLAFFRSELARRGAITCAEQRAPERAGQRAAIAGLVLVRQRPGTAKGVVFLTLEDETASANIIVWRKVFEANRRVLMTARLLLVRGTIEREGLVVHLIAASFTDLSDELQRLPAGEALPPPHARPAQLALPRSRDFH